MTEKTAILSLRISPELKRKLEARADDEHKTLTEFVRKTLAHSQEESVMDSAKEKLAELQTDVSKAEERISNFQSRHTELMDQLIDAQNGLVSEMENRRRILRRNRLLDILLMTMFCVAGSVLGGLITELMRIKG
ncbi:DUF1778 domain-containing protein [Neisseria meningitidis]|uniref:DUF1778 domain-containing protein n=1 Tax=Neisseria meningitidis TaxID=487 RepID=UPI0021F23002|nr:DUF1778 domain-containing protein [Neisseria meningitidis]MCV6721554.1 DUF1778 domain-containing protein [Neisseria meningitidis]